MKSLESSTSSNLQTSEFKCPKNRWLGALKMAAAIGLFCFNDHEISHVSRLESNSNRNCKGRKVTVVYEFDMQVVVMFISFLFA